MRRLAVLLLTFAAGAALAQGKSGGGPPHVAMLPTVFLQFLAAAT